MKNIFLLLILLLSGCASQTVKNISDAENDRFTFGKVISVNAARLTVKEYDFAKDFDVVTTYQVTQQTEFGNINKLADLQPGDDVVIDYLQEGRQRRVTTLVKEEKGGDTEPHPGHLVIAPDFQQIGDTEDGGGIMRAMTGTMALLSTNATEQERLAELSHQPTLPATNSPPNDVNLSGIHQWIASASDLPEAVHLTQWSAFAPWKLLVWGDDMADTTVALFLTNELQFAWQGFGMVTTGPTLPETPGETPRIRFEGPPAGTDLDGDGVPDLLILDYSGGAHCCSTVKHIVCSDPPVLTAQISGWHSEPTYRDLDGDGRYEMIIGDSSYAYWNACYAASPSPRVIFRIRHGHYEIAGDLMRSNAPAADKIAAEIKDLQHRLSRYDLMESRTNQPEGVKLTEEEQADEDFFFGQTWHPEDGSIRIPSPVWDLLLNLIYSGQTDAAVNALDTMWPAGKPHKAAFANDLLAMIRGSWYGRHLPWFNELEKAFAQHYPPPK